MKTSGYKRVNISHQKLLMSLLRSWPTMYNVNVSQHVLSALVHIASDEMRGISNREQFVLCIRWVSDWYKISEDFVELIQLRDKTTETIHKSLKVHL